MISWLTPVSYTHLSDDDLELLRLTPAAYLGSCRFKLPENLSDSCLLYTSLQEQKQLEHYLTAHTGISEAVIYLGLYTGLRVGELCALRWENIHFSDRCV